MSHIFPLVNDLKNIKKVNLLSQKTNEWISQISVFKKSLNVWSFAKILFFLNDEMSQLHKKLSLFLYSNIKSWKMKKNYLLLGKETVSASLQQVNIIFSKLVLNWNITHQLLPYEEKA